jgi:hypothetical protein
MPRRFSFDVLPQRTRARSAAGQAIEKHDEIDVFRQESGACLPAGLEQFSIRRVS